MQVFKTSLFGKSEYTEGEILRLLQLMEGPFGEKFRDDFDNLIARVKSIEETASGSISHKLDNKDGLIEDISVNRQLGAYLKQIKYAYSNVERLKDRYNELFRERTTAEQEPEDSQPDWQH